MRILHVTKKYPNAIGGDATYVAGLEKEQIKNGDEVFILTSNCREIIDKNNLYKFGLYDKVSNWDKITFKRMISLLSFFFYFPFILKKIRPTIVHAHSVELGFLSSLWTRFLNIPLILTCHTVAFPYKDEDLFRRIADFLFLKFGRYKKIITVDASSLIYFKKINLKNYLFLPVGIDLNIFKNTGKEEHPKLNNKITFLFVGRLEKIKGLEHLLRAARIIRDKNKNFEILIVGEGSQEKRLKQLCKKLNLGFYLRFLGPIFDKKEIIKIYHLSNIFVLPSIRERCPNVLLEAWASNLAVIATNTGSIPKVCTHLQNAFLVPPQDLGALSNAMLTLIDDEHLRKYIADNGNRLGKKEFSLTEISRKLKEIYLEAQE